MYHTKIKNINYDGFLENFMYLTLIYNAEFGTLF